MIYMDENFEVINMWSINRKKCLECEACVGVCPKVACVGVCPKVAIELKKSGIMNNEEICILCGFCEEVCPVGAIEVIKDD